MSARLSEVLAAYLLDQAAAAGKEGPFVLDIPKRIVAGRLGMTAADFARSLNRLARAGVHRQHVNGIVVSDLAALRRLVAGETDRPRRKRKLS